jgi:hypothetical protein
MDRTRGSFNGGPHVNISLRERNDYACGDKASVDVLPQIAIDAAGTNLVHKLHPVDQRDCQGAFAEILEEDLESGTGSVVTWGCSAAAASIHVSVRWRSVP